MNLHDLLERAESLRAADKPGGVLARFAGIATRNERLAVFLRGAWLGHPVLVTVPIGAWPTAALLDLTGQRSAARQVTALGLAAVPAAALAGLTDYTDLNAVQRRVAVTHAAANVVATVLAISSFTSRCRRRHTAGAVLNALGLAATGAGGGSAGTSRTHRLSACVDTIRRSSDAQSRSPAPDTARCRRLLAPNRAELWFLALPYGHTGYMDRSAPLRLPPSS